MKKNKMMRLASVLLVCVLLTTSVISGTFAKYVTSGNASDTARVAKFGVTVGSSGSLFSHQYSEDNSTDDLIAYSVVSSNSTPTNNGQASATTAGDKVVAPGTKNTDGITFTITGTPEVAVDVAVEVTGASNAATATDVYLAAGEHLDYTTGNNTADKFNLAADYHPVVYTLKDGADHVLVTGPLSDIEDYLENLSGRYYANTNLSTDLGKASAKATTSADGNTKQSTDGKYTLTWEWQFSGNDQADTFLGNWAADPATVTGTGSINTEVGVKITVTQVD